MRVASLSVLFLAALAAVPAQAQTGPAPGTCILGSAQNDLNVGRVFARVFNTGSLFYGNQTTAGDGYIVPRQAGHSSVFAAGLWVGGMAGGDLRVAGGRYEQFNFYPGPLGADGRPPDPTDCSPFDRIYGVSRLDIDAYDRTGAITDDLRDWPVALGAPVFDGDGVADNYDLAAGDRPAIVGDQSLWWVMNDVGAPHTVLGTPPLGIEVRVLAFAFVRPDGLGDATFYRYTLVNKSGQDITDAYASFFTDPDLGAFADDYAGSDSTTGLGYVYNGAEADAQYGVPPAVGFTFLLGPVVEDRDGDGRADTLGTTATSSFNDYEGAGEPQTGQQVYNVQQGLWRDGTPMRARGNGYGPQGGAPVTRFFHDGNPVTGQGWSEVNNGQIPPVNTAGDRNITVHTGPFTLAAGASQEALVGVLFAQGTDRLDSVDRLRRLARTYRNAARRGLFDPVRLDAAPPEVPSEVIRLGRPSPNPFTRRAAIRYEMPPGTRLRATLHDVLGRRIAVLADGPTATAGGEILVDGAGLAPGVYRVRVTVPAGERVVTLVRAR